MEDNYVKFMHAFNKMQYAIAKRVGVSKNSTFGEIFRRADETNNKIIQNYHDQINSLRELRNVLTHEVLGECKILATPNDAVIEQILEITQKIEFPMKANDLFRRKVFHFNLDDSLKEILGVINSYNFSQFPVFSQGNLCGLITENGITRFLSDNVDEDIISISDTTVRDIIGLDEQADYFEIIKEQKSIYDIEQIFIKKARCGKGNYTLLMAKNGQIRKPDDISGIITPWDIPIIVENK